MRYMLLLLALTLSTAAFGFTAQNGLIVQPEGPEAFSVPWRGKSGPADFWCAAGDYAIRSLHLAPSATIYRASEPPRRAGEAIRFTLRADQAASSSGLARLGGHPAGLSAGASQAFCEFERNMRR